MMLTTPAASLNRLSLSEPHTKHRNSPSLPVRCNLLIKLNCAELEQLANSLILSRNAQSVCREIKGEQYSGSAEHYRYSGSVVIQHGCNNENQQVTGKEKGGTENTALCGYGFYHHELNQHLAARQDLQLVRNYSQNPYMLNDSSNLRNDNANLRNYKNQHIAEQYARTCETFVGQPFGTQRALNWRLIPFSCLLNSCLISSSSEFNASNLSGNPLLLISFTAASSSSGLLNSVGKMLSVFPVIKATLCLHNTVAGQSHEIPIWLATSKTFTLYRSVLLLLSAENVYSMIFLPSSLLSIAIQPFGSSLDFLRCSPLSLRPHASSTHDEKLTLGLSSFSRSTLASIWSISAWGKRIPFVADLLFLALVAMKRSPLSVMTPYTNFERKKRVDVPQHLALMCPNTLIILGAKKATPQSATNTAEASIHNVNEAYTMEYSHSTQTRPKFQYLFLAVHRSDLNAKPHRESVTAHSEQDARRSLAGQFVLSFAGRIPNRRVVA